MTAGRGLTQPVHSPWRTPLLSGSNCPFDFSTDDPNPVHALSRSCACNLFSDRPKIGTPKRHITISICVRCILNRQSQVKFSLLLMSSSYKFQLKCGRIDSKPEFRYSQRHCTDFIYGKYFNFIVPFPIYSSVRLASPCGYMHFRIICVFDVQEKRCTKDEKRR